MEDAGKGHLDGWSRSGRGDCRGHGASRDWGAVEGLEHQLGLGRSREDAAVVEGAATEGWMSP